MFRAILLPVDLGAPSSWRRPAELAVELARREGGTIHVLSVLPDFGMPIVGSYFPPDFEKKALDELAATLAKWKEEHLPDDVKAETHVAHGSIYREIIRAAERLGCDAIVMAAHRPELRDYLLGSNAARVVRHARQSVLIVRE